MSNVLSRETIISEAIGLLNDEGLDQFSLRKVAGRLNVKAPSLYWYVTDKADLLALVAESIFRECLREIAPCSTWQEWLQEFGLRLWTAQNSARDLGRLMLMAKYSDHTLDQLGADISACLSPYDLAPQDANMMQSAVQAYVTGWGSLARGPNGDYLAKRMDVEGIFRKGLTSLIAGFSAS